MEGSELSGGPGLSVLWSLRTLKIAQGALRAAQSCSESLRAAQSFQCSGRSERSKSPRARSGPPRAAQNRSEPLRVAQSGRSELFQEPLRVAQSAHRALVAACARSEPAQDCLHLCVRICSSKKLFDKAVSGLLHSAFLNLVLLSSVNVYSRVHTSI